MSLRHSLGLALRLLSFLLIDIILAAERCPNCLDGECQESGECTKGCIEGFADKYCQLKCQPTCKDANCQVDKNTGRMICLSGCKDGYCGQQCKAPCEDGCVNCNYRTCTCPRCTGDKCQHSCLDGCSLCDKEQCLFCRDGLHGRNCEQTCDRKCKRCKQETGKCIKCQQGFHGDSCDQVSIDEPDLHSPNVILIVILIFVILGICCQLFACINGCKGIRRTNGISRGTCDVPHDSETSPCTDESLLGDV